MPKAEFLPSYEETIASSVDENAREKVPQEQRIIDRLEMVRSQHIRSIVEQHICPEVKEQTDMGIARTVLVLLLPANSAKTEVEEYRFESELEPVIPRVDLVGFSIDDHVRIIQLEGIMNQAGFWKQTGVTEDLQRALFDHLSSPRVQTQSPCSARDVRANALVRQTKKSLFKRFTESVPRDSQTSMVHSTEIMPEERINVSVEVDEGLCQRTVSAMGLNETRTRQGVVVKIDIRS
ncbi:hypothetical protein EJ05DRAFT_168565 [Pseudovirgaria hyperparasitica]|uniref:Uncharacterized protein n=1 Tax=Pseudovirgaria hyperparasitica TaxID=470096 RepID=A0A6A6VVN1_9PEZI|nr:uncharacterized protein EJ05DRAFT_168565 [Pseudovirgaria hyperparasitica]KAF2753690.1 hypothetical protein EJ05DRAFT_168565 [Pseudovirgaria hyperparasitica]